MSEYAFVSANEMGSKFDDQIEQNLEIIYEGKERMVRGPVMMLHELQRLFGAETLATWPVPDSEGDEKTNHPVDKLKKRVPGKDKPQTVSWYADLYAATPKGKVYTAQLAAISEARKDDKGTVPAAYADYKRMTKLELSVEEARIRGRVTLGKNLIKRAMKVNFQMLLLQEQLPKVGMSFIADDKGNITTSPQSIAVFNPDNMLQSKAVTVGTFLGYDVMQAKADGGTVQDLWETAGGEAKDDTDGDGEHTFDISVKTFDSLMAAMLNFFEAGKGVNAVTLKGAMKGWDDHSILSFGDAVSELNNLYTSPEFQERYVPLATGAKIAAA